MTLRGHLFDLGKDVRCDQYGVAFGERLNQIANGDHLMRVKPAGRLVQNQNLGITQQRLSDRDALAETAGKLAGQKRHDARQIEPLRGRVHGTFRDSNCANP